MNITKKEFVRQALLNQWANGNERVRHVSIEKHIEYAIKQFDALEQLLP